jgi:hypothetical protein
MVPGGSQIDKGGRPTKKPVPNGNGFSFTLKKAGIDPKLSSEAQRIELFRRLFEKTLPAWFERWRFGNLSIKDVKESKRITLSSSDSTTAPADFTYSMRGKVISITYLGGGSIQEEPARILRRIEHWHQGSVTSFRILYQDADGLGGEVTWDGEKAEIIAPR